MCLRYIIHASRKPDDRLVQDGTMSGLAIASSEIDPLVLLGHPSGRYRSYCNLRARLTFRIYLKVIPYMRGQGLGFCLSGLVSRVCVAGLVSRVMHLSM